MDHPEQPPHHYQTYHPHAPPPPQPLPVTEHSSTLYHDPYHHYPPHNEPYHHQHPEHVSQLEEALIHASENYDKEPVPEAPVYKPYKNVNERPLQFQEMTHEAFAPPGYNGPREPFAPPASLYTTVTEPVLPQYVSSLPEYPPAPAYGEHSNEGYTDYYQPLHNPDYDSYTHSHHQYHHHQQHYHQSQHQEYQPHPIKQPYQEQYHPHHLPSQEYIPADLVHHHQEEELSPLYLHHGPGGYDDQPEPHIAVHEDPAPVYHPEVAYVEPPTSVPVYTPPHHYYQHQRQPKHYIQPLHDHATERAFAYEEPPNTALSGHRDIDKNFEHIHRAFVEGDTLVEKK